jgi:hypothetical protein
VAIVHIDGRFNGPPGVVNGGYACATLATALGGVAEVTLRRPVPVATDLTLACEDERVSLRSPQGELLALATPGVLDVVTPKTVPVSVAEAAMRASPTRATGQALFPCFVCSPHRPDGFRVTPGPVPARDVVAAVWRPDRELADAQGRIPPAFAWALLDCTGSIGAMVAHSIPAGVVLGRMTAEVRDEIRPGETLVALGWAEPGAGRKLPACAALFREGGECIARARLVCFAT